MGIDCLSECPECNRHVRCGERACPFCGAKITSFLRVLEYRIVSRLDRSRLFSLGAALTAAGFLTNCEEMQMAPVPVYGLPCAPNCGPIAGVGGQGGSATAGSAGADSGGMPALGGAPVSGEGGVPGEGGSNIGGAPADLSAGAGGEGSD